MARPRSIRLATMLLWWVICSACTYDFEALFGAGDDGGGGGGGGGTGGSPSAECAGFTKGPPMRSISKPDGGIYCIDTTEVTHGQYQEFLDAAVSLGGQPPDCAFNTDWSNQDGSDCGFDCTPASSPEQPRVCVDWCDAHAFCLWAGKRLCGDPNGDGSGEIQDVGKPALDAWYRACAKDGRRKYPYGAPYDPNACNDGNGGSPSLLLPESMPACEGGYDDLFDMSGNVSEWTNDCFPLNQGGGPTDISCGTRGGSYISTDSVQLDCSARHGRAICEVYASLGFRCCAFP